MQRDSNMVRHRTTDYVIRYWDFRAGTKGYLKCNFLAVCAAMDAVGNFRLARSEDEPTPRSIPCPAFPSTP